MLGYLNNKIAESSPALTVVPGKNCYPVNLKPWDIIIQVKVSKLYPDGKKIIPAATQEDFKKILEATPGEEKFIKELNPEQERIITACLEKNCAWYQKQIGKFKDAPIKEQPTKS